EVNDAALGAAHAIDGGIDVVCIDGDAVDADDRVTGAQPGVLGRGARHAVGDADPILRSGNLYADARIGTAGGHLHVFEFVIAQEGRVRIERLDHATDRRLHELVLIDR